MWLKKNMETPRRSSRLASKYLPTPPDSGRTRRKLVFSQPAARSSLFNPYTLAAGAGALMASGYGVYRSLSGGGQGGQPVERIDDNSVPREFAGRLANTNDVRSGNYYTVVRNGRTYFLRKKKKKMPFPRFPRRRKPYSKRRKAKRGKMAKSKRSKRSRRAKANRQYSKSLGQVAITGGRSEEDYAVKRHMKYGVVLEYGESDQVSSAHGVGIVQSTVPGTTFGTAIMLALVKTLWSVAKISMKNPTDKLPNLNGYTMVRMYIAYWTSGATTEDDSAQSQVNSADMTTGTNTFLDMAISIRDVVDQITAAKRQGIVKFGTAWLTGGDSSEIFAQIDLDTTTFNIDLVSNLVYQNRSKPATDVTNAQDVAQEPLFEVMCDGNGTGPVPSSARWTGGFIPGYFVSTNSGTRQIAFSDPGGGVDTEFQKQLLAEPSKYSFTNCRYVKTDIANPGVVKQSKLKTHLRLSFTRLFKYMMNYGSTYYDYNQYMIGRYRYHWFRKTIDLALSTDCNVAYQHHWAAGVTCKYKNVSRTVAHVINIQ